MAGPVLEKQSGDDHEDDVLGLQRAVKKLHFGVCWEERELAAMEIGTLAKEDVKVRKLVGGLGVISFWCPWRRPRWLPGDERRCPP
ncbi:U-box domain-containing protein 7 [Prunus yedoensis var. nudiflora]|uniref:U-box domain-containing protein 7 n=1 Tax=Prunus yedoensis var. nudiflora TaxID=2094558 RepID=A0A314YGD8_PRUYE|nr:U-box domain-containing protein 7 [Prunus yedoensis var. nudiflora]